MAPYYTTTDRNREDVRVSAVHHISRTPEALLRLLTSNQIHRPLGTDTLDAAHQEDNGAGLLPAGRLRRHAQKDQHSE